MLACQLRGHQLVPPHEEARRSRAGRTRGGAAVAVADLRHPRPFDGGANGADWRRLQLSVRCDGDPKHVSNS